ncbi:MAG TPA: hypothetical protein VKQ54_08155, partial [Caulobacteraceae bacterium]|nr:hypothetical protein [Caulobacteraceae bacterium]
RRVSRMTVRDALLLSNLAFLALAALTLVAGLFVFLLNRAVERAKDREVATYQSTADVRIQSARADAAAALERAIALESENLRTRERTAMLVHDAAAMHLQALSGRGLAPQTPAAPPLVAMAPSAPSLAAAAAGGPGGALSNDQRGRMISVLIRSPGDVTVINGIGSDPERRAADLRAVFRAAGWQVETGVVIQPKVPLAPVSLVLGSSEQDKAVRRAFAAAGVGVADRPRSPMDRPTTVYVGS